jgi:hypothetical protein
VISGTITGLVGQGLILSDNGDDSLAVASGATTFSFVKPLAAGASYAVTVLTQPASPAQTCTVVGATGVATADVAPPISIVCSTETFTIGGTVSGLAGTGLVLQNNAGDDLVIPAGATTFAFATPLASDASYAVTVLTQPSAPAQNCTIEGGIGTTMAANVTNIAVTCVTQSFTVGGTVTGLTGAGLVLQNNAGDNVDVAAGTTSFTFSKPIASGGAYAVTVLVQPSAPTQTCTVTAGTGTVTAANVATVAVTCSTKTFTVGGTISGLTGAGMVLQDNAGDNLAIAGSATTFTFATPLPSGAAFAVTVSTQPMAPAQNCTVSGGGGVIGSANVSSVVINCAVDKFTIGGQVAGLRGTLVLHNGSENQTVTSDGMFAFPTPISSGAMYAVTVASQPASPSQTCVVANGSGQIGSANVSNINITCTTNTFHIQASLTGLLGNGLVLRNGVENVLVHGSDPVVFPTAVASGGGYSVVVALQPTDPWQTCVVGSNAAGVIGAADVVVPVVCVTNAYNVRVTVTGLAGTGLVLQNGADSVPVASSSTFNLPTKVASGATYAVTVAKQPVGLSQTCTVAPSAPAVVTGADVSVTVSCVTNSYKISGMITGLVGTGLVLQNNGGGDKTIPAGATSFMFDAAVLSGGSYNVSVKTQPTSPPQTCLPSANMGPVTNANVGTVKITCTVNTYSVIVTVTNLAGKGLVLQDNGADNLTFNANGTAPFATKVASGQPYLVTVLTPPNTPTQTCTVTATSTTITSADVNVAVDCGMPHSIGGKVVGLIGNGLVLRDNGADDLTVPSSATTFTFATKVSSGANYLVSVASSPTNQSCQVSNGTGPVASSDITNVSVDCAICIVLPEFTTMVLTCPTGQTIASFDFASFGTPSTGTCGAYGVGSCTSPNTASTLAPCIGQSTCSVDVLNSSFGGDPCFAMNKFLTVQARCH